MSIRITGLDKLTRELEDAQRALQNLNGSFGTISFDAADPASVDSALREIDRMVDNRLGAYRSNALVGQLAKATKEAYRKQLLDRVRKVR